MRVRIDEVELFMNKFYIDFLGMAFLQFLSHMYLESSPFGLNHYVNRFIYRARASNQKNLPTGFLSKRVLGPSLQQAVSILFLT